jgi:phosphinothricin acetyltransferase
VSTSFYRARVCYAGFAVFSVYVDRRARGNGAGRVAMDAVIDAARAAGYWKLVSRVFVENTVSRALLARVGFRESASINGTHASTASGVTSSSSNA